MNTLHPTIAAALAPHILQKNPGDFWLDTTIGNGDAPITLWADVHEVDRYNAATGREYSEEMVGEIVAVIYRGMDILPTLTDMVLASLQREIEAAFKEAA